MTRSKFFAGFLLCAWGTVACSSEPTPPDASADAGAPLDASFADASSTDALVADAGLEATDTGTADAGASTCSLEANYGTVTLVDPNVTADGNTTGRINLEGYAMLSQATPPDRLSVLLYGGFGALGPVLEAGTYTIAGPDLNFSTCGVCIFVDANVVPPNPPDQVYFATGGTLEIREVGAKFRATIRGMTFEHVTLDLTPPYASHAVGDGCVSRIEEASFDVDINP